MDVVQCTVWTLWSSETDGKRVMNSWLDVLRHSELVYDWLEKFIWNRHFYHLFILSVRHFGIRASSVPLIIDKPGIAYLVSMLIYFSFLFYQLDANDT